MAKIPRAAPPMASPPRASPPKGQQSQRCRSYRYQPRREQTHREKTYSKVSNSYDSFCFIHPPPKIDMHQRNPEYGQPALVFIVEIHIHIDHFFFCRCIRISNQLINADLKDSAQFHQLIQLRRCRSQLPLRYGLPRYIQPVSQFFL